MISIRAPALRLLADVDIFFLAELLFADFDVGFAGSGRRGFDVGRHRQFLLVIFDSGRDDGARAVGAIDDVGVGRGGTGSPTTIENSPARTLRRSALFAPRCGGRRSERSAEFGRVSPLSILTRAREAGRRDAILICSTRSIGLVGASAPAAIRW